MLDPDEIDGRMRGMVERMAEDADIDTSRPIPLGAVTRAFERMREERMRSMGGGGGDDNRGRGSSRGGSEPEYEPLVPGFGEPDLFDPVPGFGAMGERFAVKITDEDRQEASRTLSRNDRNNDGILDAEEIRRGRWGDDPLSTDRNGDGKLTLNELALRSAVRRAARGDGGNDSRSSRGSSRNSSSRSSDRGSSNSGGDSDDRRARMVQMIFSRYDRNGNGSIDRDEMGSMRGGGEQYDANRDGRITQEEFSEGLASRFGGRDREGGRDSSFYTRRGGGEEGGEGSSDGSSGGRSSGDRKSYRVPSVSERLAELEDLPDWFTRNDQNQDGQVQMSEYASSWSDDVVADFSQFDLNNDGIVTPEECLKATEQGAVQGTASAPRSSSGGYASRRSYGSSRAPASSTPSGAAATESTETTSTESPSTETTQAVAATGDGEPDQRYVKYAVGVIQRYDSNKDQMLTADEWKTADSDYASADTDGDGKITPKELANYFTRKQ
jgi:Ca2+-binding EF-hand superfamily protein